MSRALGLNALAWILAAALAGCVVQSPYPPAPYPPADTGTAPADQGDQGEEQASEPPPPIPVYEQPPCPVEGYIWMPGVWHWGPAGYYWVPGTWVAPPQLGYLWTPGYWAFVSAVYVFHPGHWGPHVGYYGGIAYGHGYDGDGYHGGRWVSNRFQYNTAVTNVNVVNVHNTYNETVVNNTTINNTTVNRTSINNNTINNPRMPRPGYAGAAGTRAQPTPNETAFGREPRIAPTPVQLQHRDNARNEPVLNAARNEGRPPVAATPHPSAFHDAGVTAAKPVGEPYRPQHPAKEDRGHENERHQ